jgi:hypothetical protein
MRTISIFLFILFFSFISFSQTIEDPSEKYENLAEKLLATDGKITIGGYAQIDYNQPFSSDRRYNGILDVHRLVMLFGYNFNSRTQFITEIEYEHVSEVYIEQAFLQYRILPWLNFRGGLMLIPMGIINEYHEPPSYNGVERPVLDNVIAPTTWRELGFGFTGNFYQSDLRYQLYLVNGFNGYDSKGVVTGRGLRSGRQKGADSYISAPNLSAKVEYYGIRGLNVGVSGYFGDTQSKLYNNLDTANPGALARADSSVVGISMLGADARYSIKGFQLRGQYYYTSLSNTPEYNHFNRTAGNPNDVGKSMMGYYVEAAYNLFQTLQSVRTELIPFIRYEEYNTHHKVDAMTSAKATYHNKIWIGGLGWKMTPGAVLKADIQFQKNMATDQFAKTFNAGIGIMF